MARRYTAFKVSLILSPDDEIKYIRWKLRTEGKSDTLDQVTCAADVHQFRVWRAKQDPDALTTDERAYLETFELAPGSEPSTHTAAQCNHPIHPTDRYTAGFCPHCELAIHLELLVLIGEGWSLRGGPFASPTHSQDILYRNAWHMARLELAETMIGFEEMSGAEQSWTPRNETEQLQASVANTASEALSTAIANTPYPAKSMHEKNATRKSRRRGKHGDRKVTFAEDTEFERPDRSLQKCAREHEQYEPGRYRCPSTDGWLDTSLMNDLNITIGQLKVFVVNEEQVDWKSGRLPAVDHERHDGPAREHPDWFEIFTTFKVLMTQAKEDEATFATFRASLKAADSIAVIKHGNSGHGMGVYAFSAEEDIVSFAPAITGDYCWTTLTGLGR